ncbi:MAG: ROK family protein [Planctomycetaceae bacterium]|nr:ROK family protein [Planctomycetales bacterium]MCB9921215.1 ROK family protein [Planctomycetaceae bacterium]
MSCFVGVDVGGTTSTIAIGNSQREVLDVSEQFTTRTAEGPEVTIASIAEEILAGLERIGATIDQLADVSLATPGPATLDGILLNTPNFTPQLWNKVPFRARLEAELRRQAPTVHVHYIGDGQAAALGEYSIRTGTVTWNRVASNGSRPCNLSSLLMVIVGTGLGGGEVRNGQVTRGKEGRAGHAGHILLPPYAFRYEHDRQLVVGNAKCTVESAVSLTALTHQLDYRLTLDQWSDHPLNSAPGSTRDKAKQLRGLASQGDPLALELFSDQARALGIGLLSANYLGDYDILVIGGGVCDLSPEVREQYRTTAEAAYREFALDGFRNLDRFEFSVCGDEAPVIGSLANAYLNATPR